MGTKKNLQWVVFGQSGWDCLPSAGDARWGGVAQAAKGTATEGGGLFCVPPVPGKQAFRAGQNAKKAPDGMPFLLVARREQTQSQ